MRAGVLRLESGACGRGDGQYRDFNGFEDRQKGEGDSPQE